ncbi:MAG TPA: TolC family protein [Phycisphaerales bacterium]|nr:TolC family protein [Phycisphaerales bacterium]
MGARARGASARGGRSSPERRTRAPAGPGAGRAARALPRISVLLGAGLLLAGCANPLFPDGADYAPALAPERLRRIERAPLDRFKVETPAPEAVLDAAVAKTRFDGVERMEMSVEEARASALRHNLDLQVSLLNPAIAAEGLAQEEGRFESVFTLAALWAETDTPISSELESAQQRFHQIEPGVRIPLRTGGTTEIRLPISRNETDNPFSTLNPAYTSDLEFSISHPLMRGAGRRATTYPIRIASYELQISLAQTKGEVVRQLAASDRAYWRLYAARAVLDVRLQQLELAQAQLDRAQRRFEAGDVAEIEVLRAQAGVAQRLDEIISAQTAVLQQQRELKLVINAPGLGVDSSTQVVTSSPPDPVRYEFDRDELLAAAVENRMEMLELELRLAADLATADWTRNQALPLLALDYTYRVNGLGGSFSRSMTTLQDNNFEDWSVGLRGEIPLGNEEREAAVRRALVQRLQRLGTRDAREQAIEREVLDAIDAIESAWQRVIATRQSVILNTRAFRAEERQFGVGESTSTDVLIAAANLGEAQLSEISAVVDYQVAQVDLAFATGTLLGADRVEIMPPDPQGTLGRTTGDTGAPAPAGGG